MINLRLRPYQIFVDELDVTEFCSGDGNGFVTVSENLIDISGLIRTTGSLTLIKTLGSDVVFDPRQLDCPFVRGARVRILVAPEAGGSPILYRTLRIIQDPAVPQPGIPVIEIELGDLLTLLDFPQPNGEETQFPGIVRNRGELINQLLNSIGAPDMQDPIDEYPLQFPYSRQSGGIVGQCGKIAFEAGYALWVDHNEEIRAVPLDPNLIEMLWDFNVGGENGKEFGYSSVSSRQDPFETLKVFGVFYRSSLESSGPPGVQKFSTTQGGISTTTMISPKYNQRTVNGDQIYSLAFLQTKTTTTGPGGTVKEIEKKRYKVTNDISYLSSVEKVSRGPFTAAFPNLEPRGGSGLTIERFTENYSYRVNQNQKVVSGRVTKRQFPKSAFLEPFNPIRSLLTDLATAEKISEDWRSIRDDQYLYLKRVVVALGLKIENWDPYNLPTLGAMLALVPDDSQAVTSTDPRIATPPNTEVQPIVNQRVVEEIFLDEVIEFTPLRNSQYRVTQAELEIQTASSIEQFRFIGNIYGSYSLGRQSAVQITTYLPDGLLAQPSPLFGIVLREEAGSFVSVAEGHSLVLGQDSCIFGFNTVLFGEFL